MSTKNKSTRTRAQYLADLKRAKAERLITAVQKAVETGNVQPFKEVCWALKAQENKRVKRAKQRREKAPPAMLAEGSLVDNCVTVMPGECQDIAPVVIKVRKPKAPKSFIRNDDALVWRNPLDLSPGYGITALHVACQLFAKHHSNEQVRAVLEEVVAVLLRPSRPMPVRDAEGRPVIDQEGVAVTLVRPGASPTLLMRDPQKGEVSCMELCPRKPGSSEKLVPKALTKYFSDAAENESATQVVKMERHSGVAKALQQRSKRRSHITQGMPDELRDLGAPMTSVWKGSNSSNRAAPVFF